MRLFPLLFIVYSCVSYLLNQILFILKLPSGVISYCQWAVCKMDIRIFFPQRLVGGRGDCISFCDCTCFYQYIASIKGSYPRYISLELCSYVLAKLDTRITKAHWFKYLWIFLVTFKGCFLFSYWQMIVCFYSWSKGHNGPSG